MESTGPSVIDQSEMDRNACWACGAVQHDVRFQRCSKCAKDKLAMCAIYCSRECQAHDWPRHKAWRKEQKQRAARTADIQSGLEISKDMVAELQSNSSEYARMLGDACELEEAGDLKRAAIIYRKMMRLAPHRCEACQCLGDVLRISHDEVGAAQAYLQAKEALETYEHGNLDWDAERLMRMTFCAYDMLCHPVCENIRKPTWWNDVDLLAISQKMVEVTPRDAFSWTMRAELLSAMCGKPTWPAGPRDSADYREAARCYERAAGLDPEQCGEMARVNIRACFEMAEYGGAATPSDDQRVQVG